MSWVKNTLSSSIGQKIVMSVTGLFLITFLIIHLIGNISLLYVDGEKFNQYAHFMKYNPVIAVFEYVLFAGFIVHIYQGICLIIKNKKARSQGYAIAHKHDKVSFTSKYTGQFGLVILVFFILHLIDFFSFKFFRELDIENAKVVYDGVEMPNLFGKVVEVYQQSPVHWIIYPLSMLIIAFHLHHGFQSAFQSLGINHKKYTPMIKTIGLVYAIVIPFGFAIIPILIKFGITIG